MHRSTAAASGGTVWLVSRQNSRIRPGMSPGATKRGSSGSIRDANAGADSANCVSSRKLPRRPVQIPLTLALLNEPHPRCVGQKTRGTVDTRLIGKIGRQCVWRYGNRYPVRLPATTRCHSTERPRDPRCIKEFRRPRRRCHGWPGSRRRSSGTHRVHPCTMESSGPSRVAACWTFGNTSQGTSIAVHNSSTQRWVRASYNCVVLALVCSPLTTPLSQ